MPPGKTYTLAEAAAELGLRPGTLREQIKNGRLAAEKVGPIWIVTQAAIDRYRRESLGASGRYGRGRPAKKRRAPAGSS